MNGQIEDKFYLHWLNMMPELGAKRLWKLKRYFGSFKNAIRGSAAGWEDIKLPRKIHAAMATRWHGLDLETIVAAEAAKVASLGINIIGHGDQNFPQLLRETSVPPLLLYCRGDISKINNKPCVAVVGTRRPSSYGLAVTEKIVADLTAGGVAIVSGLAFGIDIAAHRTALKHNGLTVAVVPGGVDELSVYPQAHSKMAATIAENGCVISECPPASGTLPYTFLARNRIIAGLSLGTVIIECAERSGALITARFARDENRAVYAVPGSIFNPQSLGPNALLGQGGIPINSAADILKDLNLSDAAVAAKTQSLTAYEKLMLQYIHSTPAAADIILKSAVQSNRLSQAEAIAALATLELKGVILACGLDQYCLVNY
jgi:DNA processing protein